MFKDLLKFQENLDESLLEACSDLFGFQDLIVLRDFGPLKKGQEIETIWFNLETSVVEVYDHEKKILEFPFRLEAENPS